MTNLQVKQFFQDKRDAACPLTNELVEKGYQQEKYGYIDIAQAAQLTHPSQWWHLMNYLLLKEELHQELVEFSNRIICGELIFWMAEVSDAVDKTLLLDLKNQILQSNDLKNREKWNTEIKNLCWEKLLNKISQQ